MPTYPETVLLDGPAFYLPTDGSIVDVVAARAISTARAASYTAAPAGQGLTKTSSGTVAATYVAITTPITGATLTLEIWGRYTGETFYQDAFACASNDHLMLVNTTNLYWGMWVSGYTGPTVARPTNSNWHHFVHVITSASVNGVFDGTCTQYLDGVLQAGAFTHQLDTKVNGVGRIADWSGTYPFGDWADAAIYTKALTPTQIAQHYAVGMSERTRLESAASASSSDDSGQSSTSQLGSGSAASSSDDNSGSASSQDESRSSTSSSLDFK